MRLPVRGLVALAVVMLTAAACGSSSDVGTTSGGGGAERVKITSPANGATVHQPFTLKWNSTVPLGPPDSGKDHVHVYTDGHANDYTVVGGNSFKVNGLTPGEHTVQISLQHADHSPVGPKSEITVMVTGGGSGGSSSPSSGDGGGGYGY